MCGCVGHENVAMDGHGEWSKTIQGDKLCAEEARAFFFLFDCVSAVAFFISNSPQIEPRLEDSGSNSLDELVRVCVVLERLLAASEL